MVDPDTRYDQLVAKLRERRYRLTPQRLAVLKVLAAGEGHPSVEQIYERVKENFPTTSRATIYKTVTLLKEMGEVLELEFGSDGSRYDGNMPYPHPHLICLQCGDICDLEVASVSQLPQEVSRRTGYRMASHRLDFFGICPQCQDLDLHSSE